MAQDQALRQCVADLPDADLERAAIADQRCRVQADGVFGVGDRLRRRRKQGEVRRRTLQHRAELVGRKIACARHERQLGIHLRDQLERRASGAPLAQHVQRRVRVAGQAVARHPVNDAFRHQLRHHVKAARQQVTGRVGIIGRDVVLLRGRHVQPASREKEKFDDADVGWQPALAQRIDIGQIGIQAEQAVDHGRDEAMLDQARGSRLFQRQRREQCQLDVRIGAGPRIEGVDDVIGLAEAERQTDHQIGADVANDLLRKRIGVGEEFRHHPWGPDRMTTT